MKGLLHSKCYLVTGGAGAIGAGIARAILDSGGKVVLLDIDSEGAEVNANQIASDGSCLAKLCDITDPNNASAAVKTALDSFGRLDGVVNNAGTIVMNAAWDASNDEWRRHMEVNVTGTFVMSQAVGQHLRTNDGGAIVNVASNCGKVGYPNMAAYNASKAAVINLTRSLSTEWAPANINVNAVCPGGVDTPMLGEVAQWLAPRLEVPAEDLLADMGPVQLGRRIEPLEVGRVVAFLLSDHAQIIRGQAINVDGGDTPY
jgi:NAD(P)-dependent dehydrogenase (short-subunit alcohol dehydrogenase family)